MSSPGNHEPLPATDSVEGVYTLETVAQITHLPREQIVFYYEHGLIMPVPSTPAAPEEMQFDDETIHRLRRLAYLVAEYQINPRGLQMVSTLLHELEILRQEVRFLRDRGSR